MNSQGRLEVVRRLVDTDIDTIDAAQCGGVLTDVRQLRGWLAQVEARASRRLRDLHGAGSARPVADELARHGRSTAAEGRKKDRRSKTLDEVPSFEQALGDGAISAEHVDALANATSQLDADTKSSLLDFEADLLADATRLTPDRFGRSVRDLARQLERDAGLERNRQQRRDTYLTRQTNHATGMVEGRFALHPELAEQIFGSIDREVRAMIAEGERANHPEFVNRSVPRNRLAAEAWGRLVAGGHQQIRPIEADVTVIISQTDLTDHESEGASEGGETAGALPIPAASVRRLICNGRVTPIIVDTEGVVINAGRTIRHANRHQRRALRAMYDACAIPGCDVPFDRCEIHHIHEWEQGGSTDLRNLIPVCSRHHHVVHDDGWHITLAADRTLTVTFPDGTTGAGPPLTRPVRRRATPNSTESRQPAA